jgi:hypothetical protein
MKSSLPYRQFFCVSMLKNNMQNWLNNCLPKTAKIAHGPLGVKLCTLKWPWEFCQVSQYIDYIN